MVYFISRDNRKDKESSKIKEPKTVMAKTKLLNEEESIKLYNEAVSLVRDIYDDVRARDESIEQDKNIISFVEKFVNQQHLGNDNILNLINISPEDDFMCYHIVNVCIISIDIGIGLGYDISKLFELGLTAFLHDIGMIKLYDIYKLPRRLTKEEYKKIKTHPLISAEILEKFRNISKKTISAASQEHERINGSGYPKGLKKNGIDEYAKIIGLADVYEAMTHERPYRSKFHPYEALKEIIDTKNSFEKRIIKVMVDRIGCPYPLGSYVELNTGEKGRVIKRNLNNPLRPIVEISYNGKKLRRPRVIDLVKYPSINIIRYLKNFKNEKRRTV